REAGLAELASGQLRQRVVGVIGRGAGRSEDRDAAAEVRERLEAVGELVVDALQALVVAALAGDRRPLGAEQLLVWRGRAANVGHAASVPARSGAAGPPRPGHTESVIPTPARLKHEVG